MPSESKGQRGTIERVMHEYKEGELRTGRGEGPKVKSHKQAVAIALSESGASNRQAPAKNAHNLRRTKGKESRGETAEAEAEGRPAQDRTLAKGRSRPGSAGPSKAELYGEARRRDIPGRSGMSKAQLQHALSH